MQYIVKKQGITTYTYIHRFIVILLYNTGTAANGYVYTITHAQAQRAVIVQNKYCCYLDREIHKQRLIVM